MALTYIKETHRTRGLINEQLLCEKHFAELPAHLQASHGRDANGYTLEVRPWRGPDRECSSCGLAKFLEEPV